MIKGGPMLKRDSRETTQLSILQLTQILRTDYTGESDLLRSVLQTAINEGMIATAFELEQACETASSLNDWPEEEGFGSSDRAHYIRRIIETTDFDRKFLQAEQELMTINRLTECPKNDTVRAYMKMNDKLKEGMVA